MKATQKIIVLTTKNLAVHPQARKAFLVWQQFRPALDQANLCGLDEYYGKPIRLCALNDRYLFFNDFALVDEILKGDQNGRRLCLVIPESLSDIQRLAWCEVIYLSRLSVHHPSLFKALQQAPRQMICELMGINSLTVAGYCKFAGISQNAFEYQQCKMARDLPMLGLPKNMNWMGDN
ncbi:MULTISPECIES: hypothetical protein [Psychrobacter]|uniref:hypothetical protein n=1 Tax=Psychrobacter TaxID=497 RepID=UPI00146D73DF|nr:MULTISPECIES: hypothetical protein [Psychrobacter]